MIKINPEHIEALIGLINRAPFFELLSMKVCELDVGHSRVEVELSQQHMNPFGAIHGGVYSSIIDTAAYWAVYCQVDESAGFTSIDLSVNNLSMVNSGKIIVEGRSLKVGRSLCLAEATAKDANGKLLAYGTSKLMMLKGKQSVQDAVKAMGCAPLPPKFIN